MSRYPRRSALWSDPRIKPPFGAVEIDWSHPLSTGMVSCVLVNEGAGIPLDLATKTALVPNNTNLVYKSGSGGPYFNTNNSCILDAANSSLFDITSEDMSAVLDFIPLSTDSAGLATPMGHGAISVDGWFTQIRDTERLLYTTNQSGVNQFTRTNDSAVILQTLNRCIFTRHGSSARIYVNGTEASYLTVGVHVNPTTSSQPSRIGASFTGGNILKEGFDRAMFYRSRVLSATEAMWLYVEPYAFLRPIIRRRYFIPPPPPFLRGTLYDDAFDLVPLYAGR